jgi:SAM-dependent methyltransferase
VGVDPSPFFLDRARGLAAEIRNLRFVEGDARSLPLEASSADVLVFHTTLCHVPEPERALTEAFRVLRPGGWLAAFDGDYATATCALGANDPLQTCIDAAIDFLVHDRWLVRRLVPLVRAAGFATGELRSHGYVEAPAGGYLLRMIERGAEALRAAGRLGADTAAGLVAEAHRRSQAGEFFGHIAYASVIARRPA